MMIYLMLCGAALSGLPMNQESMEDNRPAMVHSYSLEDFLYAKPIAVIEDESFTCALAASRAFARPANQRLKFVEP